MFTIYATVMVTRRIFLNYVIGPSGQVAYTSRDLAACLQWLCDNGETECRIDNGRKVVKASISLENLTPAMMDGLSDEEVDQVRTLMVERRMSPEDALAAISDLRQHKLPWEA